MISSFFLKNIQNPKINIIFFSIILVACKLYFLFISKASDGSFIYIANAHIFFNLKSFLYDPSYFIDWNHPGTPIYFLSYFFNFFFPSLFFSYYDKYLYLHHLILIIIHILSIIYFYYFLKKFIKTEILFSVLIILFSSNSFFVSLETVDLHSYQFPLVLFSISSLINLVTHEKLNYKNLFITSFFLVLSYSVKLSMFPLFVASYIAICVYFFTNQKKNFFFLFFLFNFFLLLFTLILNFPIIGRIPVIFYNVLFSRNDTSFNIFDSLILLKEVLLFIKFDNKYYVYLLIFLFLIYIYSLLFSRNYKKEKYFLSLYFFSFILFIFYFYVMLSSAKEILEFRTNPYIIRGINLRSSYFYIFFLVPILIINTKFQKIFLSKFFLLCVVFIFITSIANFLKIRNNYLEEVKEKNIILTKKLSKYLQKDGIIATFNNHLPYGYSSENNYYRTNNVLHNDKFAEEIFQSYPKIRYLRLHDIINQIRQESYILKKNETTSFAKKILIDWDDYIEKNLHQKIYKILSYKSSFIAGNIPVYDPKRSDNIFVKRENEKINYILISHSPALNDYNLNLNINHITQFIKKKINVESIREFKVSEDIWYLIYIKE